jgi:hypothetical protein
MRNKIFMIISFLAAVFFMSSCLKDDIGEDWTSSLEGKMYAEVWNAGFLAYPLQPVADPDTFKFLVNIATDALPTQNITVTLAVNEDALDRYNTKKGTNYLLYPYIEILTPQVQIKAGTRNAYAYVKVWNADLLNACDNFMAPISIMSATGGVVVADALNQGSRLMALPINNPYAGDYHNVGYRNHPTAGMQPFDYAHMALSTIDCQTVLKAQVGNYSGYTLEMKILTDIIDVGGVSCNKVELNIPEVPGDWGMYPDLSGAPMNYYNPVTKVFELYYYYNNAAPRIIRETLTRN